MCRHHIIWKAAVLWTFILNVVVTIWILEKNMWNVYQITVTRELLPENMPWITLRVLFLHVVWNAEWRVAYREKKIQKSYSRSGWSVLVGCLHIMPNCIVGWDPILTLCKYHNYIRMAEHRVRSKWESIMLPIYGRRSTCINKVNVMRMQKVRKMTSRITREV